MGGLPFYDVAFNTSGNHRSLKHVEFGGVKVCKAGVRGRLHALGHVPDVVVDFDDEALQDVPGGAQDAFPHGNLHSQTRQFADGLLNILG